MPERPRDQEQEREPGVAAHELDLEELERVADGANNCSCGTNSLAKCGGESNSV